MKVEPKDGILVIKKDKNTATKADIIIEENEEDKRLITGEVLSDYSSKYNKGKTVIFGRYALYLATIKGENYYFLDEEDVIAVINKE